MANTAPFVVQQELTGVVKRYRNIGYIADQVMPRVMVGKAEFKYTSFTKAEGFTIPNTLVSRTGRVTEVEFTGTEVTDSVKDYGLEDAIPQSDLMNASGPYQPTVTASEMLAELIALDREKRVADLVFATATYAAANKATLSGTSQWSDQVNSNPVTAITDAIYSLIQRPNKMILGAAVWAKLRTHPKVVDAVKSIGGATAGIVARQAVAELFELDELLIGEGFVNTAAKGQTAAYGRLWGKSCALIHVSNAAIGGRLNAPTFGFTAQFGDRVAMVNADANIGLRGGQRIRVGESVKEVIVAADVGYLFDAAVA